MRSQTRFKLNVSPLRAWSAISDLSSFSVWHPTYQFRGEARSVGARLKLRWRIARLRTTQVDTDIIALEKPRIIAWQAGVSGVISYRERYEIAPDKVGVEISHQTEWRGLLGRMIGPFMARGVRRLMAAQDRALMAHLKRETRSTLFPNRHKRRAAVARDRWSAAND